MSDLVERLRTLAEYLPEQKSAFIEAADEIERLRARLAFEQRCHRVAVESRTRFEYEIDRLMKLSVRLEARPADGGDWTEVYPAQLNWIAKEGHEVRAVELFPSSDDQ